jgi:hypothetical protein
MNTLIAPIASCEAVMSFPAMLFCTRSAEAQARVTLAWDEEETILLPLAHL